MYLNRRVFVKIYLSRFIPGLFICRFFSMSAELQSYDFFLHFCWDFPFDLLKGTGYT